MGKESQPTKEVPTFFTGYSGTSLSNFLIGGSILDTGSVVFDKRKNPLHRFPNIFFKEKAIDALEYAAGLALETLDIPVVMAGPIPSQYRGKITLPSGFILPVSTLWIPRAGMGERERIEFLLQATHFGETQEAFNSMVQVDPAMLLRDRS